MKLFQLINFLDIKSLATFESSFKTAYKIAKITEIASTELKFYQAEVKKLFEKYAEKDSNGNYVYADNSVKIKNDCLEICKKELDDLGNLDIEFNENYKFTIDELDSLKISQIEMMSLIPFIKE